MAANDKAASTKERTAKREERAAQRAKKQEGRSRRQSARTDTSASGRPERLCSLATVEVKKGRDGFQVAINGSAGRKAFTIASNEASQVLRDLETAIQVMRGQA